MEKTSIEKKHHKIQYQSLVFTISNELQKKRSLQMQNIEVYLMLLYKIYNLV